MGGDAYDISARTAQNSNVAQLLLLAVDGKHTRIEFASVH